MDQLGHAGFFCLVWLVDAIWHKFNQCQRLPLSQIQDQIILFCSQRYQLLLDSIVTAGGMGEGPNSEERQFQDFS